MNNPTGGATDFLLAKAIERAEKAEAEVERLRAHVMTAIDHWTNGRDQDVIDVLHAAVGETAS